MGSDVNRRDLIKRAAAVGLVAAPATAFLTSCASGGGGKEKDGASRGNKSGVNPFGVADDAPLDVVIFKGGYGDDYAKAFEKLYQKQFTGAEVSHLGTPEISGKLQPRFNAGNPPDVVDDSGAQQIKLDVLHKNGQLADLTPLLDAPSVDDPAKKVRDILLPGTAEQGYFDGKMYSLNYVYTVWGLWYSGKLFKEKGYTAPKTWADFMTLAAETRKDGLPVLCHQGKHPYYINCVIMDMIAKNGGLDAMKAIDNLDPKAFAGNDSARKAVEAVYEIVDKGYLLPGTNGLDHIQSQTAWNKYKAAFIPSGSWLENEQLKSTPPDFAMTFLPIPSLDGDQLPFEAIRAGAGEPFIVPEKARNKAGGMEFLRIMLSKAGAAKFATEANSLSIVKDALDPGVRLRPGTESANDALAAAGENTFNYLYPNWYSEMDVSIQNASRELMSKRIKPGEWLKQAQKAVDKAAKDPAAKKNKRD